VMVLAGDAKGWAEVGAVLAAVAVTAVACWGVLSMASAVNRVMGATGRAVLLRVTGLLLAAVAVQFMISGVTEAFPFLLGSK
jgi:multiple antibiotic resistance protein